MPVEQIAKGDIVFAWDEDTAAIVERRVLATYTVEQKEVFDLELDSAEIITVTGDHPFWVLDEGAWIDVALLRPGMRLLLMDGAHCTIAAITRLDEPRPATFPLPVAGEWSGSWRWLLGRLLMVLGDLGGGEPVGGGVAAGLRVALVHDWLNGMRGGERVFEHLCLMFPDAEVFTLLHEPERLSPVIQAMRVHESPFASLPGARRHYRYLLPLMPRYVAGLPTADFDVVISTSHCVAKGAPPPRRGVHLSYVFSPMRYVWDHYRDYLSGTWWKDAALGAMRGPLQRWDRRSCAGVDGFAADSAHIARKIERFWGRRAEVILPPVNLELFTPSGQPPEDYFLVLAALVPYKRVDRAIVAARRAGVRLVVVGDGPERERLEALAGPGVEFVGRVPDEELPRWYRGARALIYPGVEDFGITALEAQACGRPVIAMGRGGATETVVEGVTGAFFAEPSAISLARALRAHDDGAYDPVAIRCHAEQFSPQAFRRQIADWVDGYTRFLM